MHQNNPPSEEYVRQGLRNLNIMQEQVGKAERATSPLDVQVAGDHYKSLKIQPVEYIHANQIPFIEGSVIKYVTRWKNKGGVNDLQKAKHFIDLLIELETRNNPEKGVAENSTSNTIFGTSKTLNTL